MTANELVAAQLARDVVNRNADDLTGLLDDRADDLLSACIREIHKLVDQELRRVVTDVVAVLGLPVDLLFYLYESQQDIVYVYGN